MSALLSLAEGSAKKGHKDRKKFFVIALGSLREVQAIMELTDQNEMVEKSDKLGAHIFNLIRNPGPGPSAWGP